MRFDFYFDYHRSIKCESLTLLATSGFVILVGLTIALIISIAISTKVQKLFEIGNLMF